MNLLAACLLLTGLAREPAAVDPPFTHRWVYYATNLWVDKNVDALEAVLRRAARAGYNGLLLSDSKFGRLATMDARYFRNVDRVKKVCAELRLEIVPAVFPLGYSESLLSHDPNLAEALPVRDAPLVVRSGVARLVPDRRELVTPTWKDEWVTADGDVFSATDPAGRNARVVFQQKVTPFRQYHLAVQVRTADFRGDPRIQVLAAGKPLLFSDLGVKPTQEWTMHHAVFNSLEHDEVAIYFGCWDGRTGTLAWKTPVLEEVALLNVVRRGGAPLVLRHGEKVLVEGQDYEPIADPRMGSVPWSGAYDVWHEPPAVNTRLPDGTRLLLSYHHAITVHDGQVMVCPSEPKTVELLRDEAHRVHAAFGAKSYLMSHDEIRVLNRDEACVRRNLDAGAILADNARTCVKILRETNPRGRIYVWSDMFDPNHNAHADYYLVRGDLAGSWAGLDQDVVIVAWYRGAAAKTLPFFAGRGHRLLIAGYYDGPVEDLRGWLEAARDVKGVLGVMYTTWRANYDDLESFARLLPGG